MNWRRIQVLGLLAVVVGFVFIFADVPLSENDAEYTSLLIEIVAIVAVIVGVLSFADRRQVDGDRWQPPNPEPGYRVVVPGDELADLRESDRRDHLRHRLLVLLIDGLDCSKSEAEELIEEETWTDDALAASYLGHGSIYVPLTTQLIGRPSRHSIEQRAIHHTVSALRELRTNSTDP